MTPRELYWATFHAQTDEEIFWRTTTLEDRRALLRTARAIRVLPEPHWTEDETRNGGRNAG